nr:hypothetical protein [Spirochaetaceae bacterium]
MKIMINQEAIDFTLESESTCGEVVDQLQNWLKDQDFYINQIQLDNQEYLLYDRKSWQEKSLEELEQLNLNVIDGKQQQLLDLLTLKEYFILFTEAIEQNNPKKIKELTREYSYVKNNISQLLKLNPFIIQAQLFNPMEESGILQGLPTPSSKDDLLQRFKDIINILEGRREEILNPREEGIKTANTLIAMKERLSQIPMLLQENKDREALDLIIVLTELLSRIFRIMGTLSQDQDSQELQIFTHSLKEILKELSQAMEQQDT